ncbi:hypothetical protein IMCC14465_17890 [alpha proteobacterium IMCC14465]|uniref:Nudix hydrolase domain-containing protein n=1 Tax=alpha proteobacterium IMCC14465 TaxID=1220535 RepID=J9DF46_9PROT|nr:hypothetical protein IMCC14465_17890 [alpha proteobacterium IMCC14465]
MTKTKQLTELDNKIEKSVDERADLTLPYIRPVDAATLIIVNRQTKTPKVLMGKRSAKHKFMPNKFVFPGGRVDPCDSRLVVPSKMRIAVMRHLKAETKKSLTPARLRGLALAAIRETYEETGLVLGKPATTNATSRHPVWRAFLELGVEPALSNLDYVARAITPTKRNRRFDTRFFMADATELFNKPSDIMKGSGELLDLHWISLKEALKLDLPIITHEIVKCIEARLQYPDARRYNRPVPFYRFEHGKFIISNLRAG